MQPVDAQPVPDSAGSRSVRPFVVTVGLGGGGPSGDTRCLAGGYFLPSLEIQTRGRIFVSVGAEWIQPAGPIEDCQRLPDVSSEAGGGVLVRGDDRLNFEEGAGDLTLGLGFSLPLGAVTAEAETRMGAARGQANFRSTWLPSVTAALAVSLLNDHLILSLDRRWLRIPHWTKGYASVQQYYDEGAPTSEPDDAETQWSWKQFMAVIVGIRF